MTRCAHILCGLSRRLTPSVSNRYGVAPCIVPRDAEDAEVKRKAESELSCAFACALTYACGPKQEAMMPLHTDNLESTMRYALLTTRAIALCPFHPEVMIRVGDSDAETHAYYRARSITKSDGTGWEPEHLMEESVRQLTDAADGVCPRCAQLVASHN